MTLTEIKAMAFSILQQDSVETLGDLEPMFLNAVNLAIEKAQNRHDFKLSIAEGYVTVDPSTGADWVNDCVETEAQLEAKIVRGEELVGDNDFTLGGWNFGASGWDTLVPVETGKDYVISFKGDLVFGVDYTIYVNDAVVVYNVIDTDEPGVSLKVRALSETFKLSIKGLGPFWLMGDGVEHSPSEWGMSISVCELKGFQGRVKVKFKSLLYADVGTDGSFSTVWMQDHLLEQVGRQRSFNLGYRPNGCGGNLIFKGQKLFLQGIAESKTVRVTGQRFLPRIKFLSQENFITQNGSEYLMWYVVWFLNKRLQVFMNKQEGTMPEPWNEVEKSFQELIQWDNHLTTGGENNELLSDRF